MQVATTQQFGADLLKALGLEGQKVVELNMNLKPDGLVTLQVTRFVGLDEMQKAVHLVSSYKVELTEKPPLAKTIEALEKEPKSSAPTPHNYG